MAHIPVGYKIVDGCAVVDETAAEQIRATYRYYFEGKSLINAAKEAGFKMNHASVKRMLSNKKYLGMEAFSDGVLAIVITIMVLKLNAPKDLTLDAVKEVFPTFLAYILSFIYVGIYWANHHHLINMTDSVSGRLLWKNLHWIFWMSLIPMATEWMGLNPYKSLPALFYGIILFMCAVSYNIVQAEVIKINGKDSQIFRNIGNDLKGKLSIIAYAAAIIFAFYFPVISYLIYIAIALTWIVPDSRLEKA